MSNLNLKEIYFAGGCFWGVDAYFSQLKGVVETESGYAQGEIENPTYEEVSTGKTGFTETVKIVYDPQVISLESLCDHYFRIIDPFSLNKQANDIGTQYRTGIYYVDPEEKNLLSAVYNAYECQSTKAFAVELEPLKNFYPAESYHQKYLEKNPGSYCHIDLSLADVNEKKESHID